MPQSFTVFGIYWGMDVYFSSVYAAATEVNLNGGKDHVITHMFDFDGLEETVEALKDKPVYFTIDLDVLDPSVFPGTGTPEAGGVTFKELLNAVLKASRLNIVGMDLNELSPMLDASGASTAVALKIMRELLLAVYNNGYTL